MDGQVARPSERERASQTPYSSSRGAQSVNSKFSGRSHQLCALGEVLCEFRIIIQPPKCVGSENEMRRAAATQLLKIGNHLLAVARSASVNGVFLEEVPALALRIVKYRRITHVRGNNQGIGRRNFVQFETGIAELSGRRSIEWPHVNVSQHCKRTGKQYRQGNGSNARGCDLRSDKCAGSASKSSHDWYQRQLIPSMAIAVANDDQEEKYRGQPPMKKT